jgi:hypothetical protein
MDPLRSDPRFHALARQVRVGKKQALHAFVGREMTIIMDFFDNSRSCGFFEAVGFPGG